MKNYFILIFVSAVYSLPALALETTSDPYFLDAVESLANSRTTSTRQKHDRIVEIYRSHSDPTVALNDATTLRLRLETALSAAFYSKNKEIARDAAILHQALAAIGSLGKDDTRNVIASLVKAREFDWANQLLRESGGSPLPTIEWTQQALNNAGPRILVVTSDALQITSINASTMDSGIVVISNPLCGYSAAAGAVISNSPALMADLDGAVWLVPQEGKVHDHEIAQWNRVHPRQQMVLAYDWLDWPEIDDWSTPTFYFFADGRVVEKVSGWPMDGSKTKDLARAVQSWRKAKEGSTASTTRVGPDRPLGEQTSLRTSPAFPLRTAD